MASFFCVLETKCSFCKTFAVFATYIYIYLYSHFIEKKKETRVEQDSYARDLILPTTDIIYKQRSSLMNNEEEGV